MTREEKDKIYDKHCAAAEAEIKDLGIGYKVFNPDWTCRGYQYEVGNTYVHDGEIGICEAGFHFCPTLIDCFSYYAFDSDNKVAIVHYDKSKSLMPADSDKWVTSLLHVEKEIKWDDVVKMCNIGKYNIGHRNTGDSNSGHRNSGDRNSGDWNSGHWNSGDRNSGDSNSGDWNSGNRNSGDRNTGDWNTGDWNTGDRNTGDWNTGHRNTGDWNTGNWNTGDWNTGYLCTDEPPIRIFDAECSLSRGNIIFPKFFQFALVLDVPSRDMTESEKERYPEHEVTGGCLRVLSYHEAWRRSWDAADDADRRKVLDLPNWNNEKFKHITGIDAEAELNAD